MNTHRRTRRTALRASGNTPQEGEAPAQKSQSPDLANEPLLPRDELMPKLRDIIDRAAPAMVQSVANQAAASGSYLPTRFLLEFAGLSAVPPPPNAAAEHSLTALLLRSLGVAVPNNGAATE